MISKVTATAKQMVMRFGMSDKLGPRVFGHDHGQPFLGREFSSEPDCRRDRTRDRRRDPPHRRGAHQTARAVLEDHREHLEMTSEILLKRETIEREQFIELLDGKSEEQVFGSEAACAGAAAVRPRGARAQAGSCAPAAAAAGLAGGTAEMRGGETPEARARPRRAGRPTRFARLP